MRIFLYGDPYYIRTVIRCLEYTHSDWSDVFLANDRIADNILYSSQYNISIPIDISVINDSKIDELWIITSNNIHPPFWKDVVNTKIKCKIIRMNKMPLPRYSSKIFDSALLKGKSSILSLSIGKGAQQYFTELLINKKLNERKIKFYQQFSPKTSYLLSNRCLNSPISWENMFHENYDLFVGGISVNNSQELLNSNLSACKAIRRMRPDSAIISCCNSPFLIENDIKTAVNILYYQYNIKKIIIMVSEYYCNQNVAFPMRTQYRCSNFFHDTLYLSDIDFYQNEDIVDQLLSPVYLPDGIIPLGEEV